MPEPKAEVNFRCLYYVETCRESCRAVGKESVESCRAERIAVDLLYRVLCRAELVER